MGRAARWGGRALWVAGGLGVAFIFVAPLWWMVAASFKPEHEIFASTGTLEGFNPFPLNWDNYAAVFRRVPFIRSYLVTVAATVAITTLGVIANGLAAYALARLRFPGRAWLTLIIIALIIVPFESILLPLFVLVFTLRLVNTFPVLVVPFVVKAFNIFFLRQYFLGLPRSLEESALVDGASYWTIFWRIILPISKPAIATVAVIDIVTHWSDFLWPLLVTTDETWRPIQVTLSFFFHQPPIQWGDIMAFSVMATVPLLLVYLFAQRYLVEGFSALRAR